MEGMDDGKQGKKGRRARVKKTKEKSIPMQYTSISPRQARAPLLHLLLSREGGREGGREEGRFGFVFLVIT
jgi:hypothetical protein